MLPPSRRRLFSPVQKTGFFYGQDALYVADAGCVRATDVQDVLYLRGGMDAVNGGVRAAVLSQIGYAGTRLVGA